MVKIKLGAFVSDFSGKIGGSVFSKNHYGIYIRNYAMNVQPQTPAQLASQKRLTDASQLWKNLTESQRISWLNYSKNFPFTDSVGNVKILTAQNFFIRCYCNLKILGLTTLTDPDGFGVFNLLNYESVVLSAARPNTMTLTFTGQTTDTDIFYLVYASPQVSAGRNFLKNEYRLINTIPPLTANSYSIGASYISKFGILKLGFKVFIKLVPINKNCGMMGSNAVFTVIIP